MIENKKTGFLIDDIKNESAYLERIKDVIRNPKNLNSIRKNGLEKLQEQHSWTVYLDKIRDVFC